MSGRTVKVERRHNFGVDDRPALDVAGLGVAVHGLRREHTHVMSFPTREERDLGRVLMLVVLGAEALGGVADGLDLGGDNLRELALRDAIAEEEL